MNKFEYTYSAPTEDERKEIENIQMQYKEKGKTKTKLDLLRKLDSKVKNIPVMWSLVFGIVGLLVFGTGLTMILEWNLMVYGIIVGIVGFVLMGFAYYVYQLVYTKLKNKYSEQILKLSSELLNDEQNNG